MKVAPNVMDQHPLIAQLAILVTRALMETANVSATKDFTQSHPQVVMNVTTLAKHAADHLHTNVYPAPAIEFSTVNPPHVLVMTASMKMDKVNA
jgi:hypothetical protein